MLLFYQLIYLPSNKYCHACMLTQNPAPFYGLSAHRCLVTVLKALLLSRHSLGKLFFFSIVVDLSVCTYFLPSNIYFHAPSYSLSYFSWLHGSAQFPSTFLSFGSLCSKRKCIYLVQKECSPHLAKCPFLAVASSISWAKATY